MFKNDLRVKNFVLSIYNDPLALVKYSPKLNEIVVSVWNIIFCQNLGVPYLFIPQFLNAHWHFREGVERLIKSMVRSKARQASENTKGFKVLVRLLSRRMMVSKSTPHKRRLITMVTDVHMVHNKIFDC